MRPSDSKVQTEDVITARSTLVRKDDAINGLGLLLDPARLLDELRSSMDIGQVENIELNYLRYKPGMNCLARYGLQVNGQQVTAYAKAHGDDAETKIGKSMERAVSNGVLGPGRVVLDDPRVIFSTFPNDAKLVSLQSLIDPGLHRRLLGRIFGSNYQWLDSTPGEALNYKPERRYVTRFTRPDGVSSLIKFHSSGGYARARTISRKLTRNRDSFYPETIGRSKKYRVVAYRWQPGKTLRQLHNEGELTASDLMATARSLAEFHASGSSGLSRTGREALSLRLNAIAEQTGILMPRLKNPAIAMAHRLADWAHSESPPMTPVHGDFYDKQAVVDDGTVRLIDLDSACLGDPVMDLGSYVAHLERLAINRGISAVDVETQKETLVGAYEHLRGDVCRSRLDKHVAMSLFTLIHHPFRDWAHDWPMQTRHLLERVETLFAVD